MPQISAAPPAGVHASPLLTPANRFCRAANRGNIESNKGSRIRGCKGSSETGEAEDLRVQGFRDSSEILSQIYGVNLMDETRGEAHGIPYE